MKDPTPSKNYYFLKSTRPPDTYPNGMVNHIFGHMDNIGGLARYSVDLGATGKKTLLQLL